MNWFQDQPSHKSPYSIHNIVKECNNIYGKPRKLTYGGEWIGPSKISRIIESLVNRHAESNLAVYVPLDGTIYLDKVMSLCCSRELASVFGIESTVAPDAPVKINISVSIDDKEPQDNGDGKGKSKESSKRREKSKSENEPESVKNARLGSKEKDSSTPVSERNRRRRKSQYLST